MHTVVGSNNEPLTLFVISIFSGNIEITNSWKVFYSARNQLKADRNLVKKSLEKVEISKKYSIRPKLAKVNLNSW